MRVTRPHWSYSQLAQYLRCPLQYYFERIAKLPRPFVPSGLAFGSAIHGALAEFHQHRQQHQDLPPDQLMTVFRRLWATAVAELPIQFRDGETAAQLEARGVGLLEMYAQEPVTGEVVAVEQTAVVPLITSDGEILEKPLVAVLDLVTRDSAGLVISEFKTSSRRYSQLETEMALQATCYTHAVQESRGQPARVRYVVLLKTIKPAIQQLETVRSPEDAARLADIARSIERAVEARAFYPVESAMNCSTCPFFQPCREWQGTATHLNAAEPARLGAQAC